MASYWRLSLSGLILFLSVIQNAYADEVITLNTGRGVRQSFLLAEPRDKPQGVVLMFPGHEGVVKFLKEENGYRVDHEGGGLSGKKKTIEAYRRKGLVAAVIAPPSDKEGGMSIAFRSSDEHLTDIRSVIDYLRQKYDQKLYVHGHCLGTFSPASITTKLKNEGIAGMVLSSTRSVSDKKHRAAVTDYQRGVVSVPVLLVQHKQDPCPGTAYTNLVNVQHFYEESSKKVDTILVSGGDTRQKGIEPCKNGAHGFDGLEEKVAGAIADWILSQDFPRQIDGF